LTVAPHRPHAQAADCRPLRAVLLRRLPTGCGSPTKLAASGSPCADYSISVPPIVADKTQVPPRPGLAHPGARAELPRASPEVHFTTVDALGREHGSSWFTAGVTARQRMAEAGTTSRAATAGR
jgi:hypothetical protein